MALQLSWFPMNYTQDMSDDFFRQDTRILAEDQFRYTSPDIRKWTDEMGQEMKLTWGPYSYICVRIIGNP